MYTVNTHLRAHINTTMRVNFYGIDGRLPCAGIAGAAEVADGREGGGMTRQEAIGEKRRLLENGGGRGRRCANLSGERSSGLVEEPERPECVDGARFRHCFSRSSAV